MKGMTIFSASCVPYAIVCGEGSHEIFSYLRTEGGDKRMYSVGPLHGRSFVVGKTGEGRYVVSKGNGLGYTSHPALNTREFGDNTWGLLLRCDAERDFVLGQEIEALGLKTNRMEYVLELEREILLPNGHTMRPALLQYDVECPYRLCDAPFDSETSQHR